MEIPHDSPHLIIPFLILIFSFLFLISKFTGKKKPGAPLAGGSWPLIGHLHLLGGPKPPHIVLGEMADKHGPIFTIKMGIRRALVVNNSEIAKECLTTHDKTFANRPYTLAMDLLGYDRSMFGFSPYGNYWRQIRKLATVELLSNHRLEMFKHVRESEVRAALQELYKLGGVNKLVEMKKLVGDITLNVISRIVVGKSGGYGKDEGWKEALRDFFDLSGRFVAADGLPFLRWLDIGGYEKKMKKTAKELDVVMMEWIKEHKQKRASGVNKGEADFIDVMLDVLDGNQTFDRDSDTVNKATCLTLILAASDTTTVTLIWALSLLVNNPNVLKKAQDELDIHVGRERQVVESDISNLVYLQAIIKETFRLYPAGPLSIPHESTEDCTVANYYIPTGTMLYLNLWKIHHDPQVWNDPFKFDPERFFTTHKDYDVRGQHFDLIPFSSGRRMCPGVSFAMQVLHLILASLLHAFDFSTPTGEAVDMTESIGLTNPRATPLQLVVNPRLHSYLYK
ncbi:cytochrome P450 CYP82D47-like [Euphorbia lathyris]|uniref:cytochrome P450 CYP82D47-like n=1 Tax=Euphorbia lathyris TaxID=212925 RepID=UPI003313E5D1